MFEAWTALPAGVIIATVVSSIGLGGGVLWMPFFLIFMGLEAGTAVVTSLFIQVTGMASGSYAFMWQKAIDLKLAFLILLISIPGISLGALIAQRLPSAKMELILGILVMTTSLWFVSSNQKYEETGGARAKLYKVYPYSWLVALGSIGSGMLSVSMGEWLVPLMRNKLSLKMRNAIGTSIFITFGTCVLSALIHTFLGGKVQLSLVLWAVPGAIIGGQIGPRVAKRINERVLKEIFIFLLTLIGIHLVYNAY